MLNFSYYNPTRIIFGKDSISKVGKEVSQHAKRCCCITVEVQ